MRGEGGCAVSDAVHLQSYVSKSYLEALPGEGAPEEVHEHVAQRLEVVSPALLCMRCDGVGVVGCG